ncbi:MAG: hypothetical protein U0531_15300 [Dehalococcoidia bacterium]
MDPPAPSVALVACGCTPIWWGVPGRVFEHFEEARTGYFAASASPTNPCSTAAW